MKKGIVYLICDPYRNLYKIGVTKNKCSRRMKQLQTGNATELQIITYYETNFPYRLESMLHNFLSHKNILNEWYDLDSEDVRNFNETCARYEYTIEMLKDNPFFSKNLR